jgi:hypothetical protein
MGRGPRPQMIGINKELEAAEAARAALATNSNSKATIKVLREAKYVAALAMTTLASHKPLNDARHAVVSTLSDLVKALETDPAAQQEKIDKAKGALRRRKIRWGPVPVGHRCVGVVLREAT